MKAVKILLVKFSNMTLALLAIMATVFANCQCMGRAYEPKVPKELE